MKKSILFFIFLLCVQTSAMSEPKVVIVDEFNEEAPAELLHWNKLIGHWRTSEEGLSPDGSGWKASEAADWSFYWALDGWAIRDEYFSPPLSEQVNPPAKRQMGTNIRVYNVDKKQWLMAWIDAQAKTVGVYTAQSNEHGIVMLSVGKLPSGKYGRITFFDIKDNSFEWKSEWSDDGQTNWLEVYRIHGRKVD
jgi:hypothetical protein